MDGFGAEEDPNELVPSRGRKGGALEDASAVAELELDRRILTVRRAIVDGILGTPKNNRVRHIPLVREVVVALRQVGTVDGYIFAHLGGQPVTDSMADRALRRLCLRTGVRHVSWHSLRHTFATHLAMAGVPLRAIQELLGHATMTMTMRYAHFAPSALGDVRMALETTWTAAGSTENANYRQRAGNATPNTVLVPLAA